MIAPGFATQHPHKRWPATPFAELAHHLHADLRELGLAKHYPVFTSLDQAIHYPSPTL